MTQRLVSRTKDSSVVHIPSNRLEVTVHRVHHEDYPMSQTNHRSSDDNVESRDEKMSCSEEVAAYKLAVASV